MQILTNCSPTNSFADLPGELVHVEAHFVGAGDAVKRDLAPAILGRCCRVAAVVSLAEAHAGLRADVGKDRPA